MSTSNDPVKQPSTRARSRAGLRLRMTENAGTNRIDGGWWPRSRNLAVELADLADHFPTHLGHIVRATVSCTDWDSASSTVSVAHGQVQVGSLSADDTNLIELETTDQTVLHVLVVPPDFTANQGAEALLAAATTGNTHSTMDLLEEVTNYPDVDPRDHWSDDGGPWRTSDISRSL